jgi:methylamine dehydrogenase light chain
MSEKSRLDRMFEASSRSLAEKSGRRSFIARLGSAMLGTTLLPLLPVARFEQASAEEARTEPKGDWNNPRSCDYWAFCSMGGSLCSCCGGASDKCPPGTWASAIAWVGTCRNPGDGKSYVMAYHDCCGTTGCFECACHREEGSTPRYRLQRSPYVSWCYGAKEPTGYTCTISKQLSVAK